MPHNLILNLHLRFNTIMQQSIETETETQKKIYPGVGSWIMFYLC